MLVRLAAVQRVGSARALCGTLLRLLSLCARVRRCVRVLTRADTRALPVLLHALHLAALEDRDVQLVYQLLEVMLDITCFVTCSIHWGIHATREKNAVISILVP